MIVKKNLNEQIYESLKNDIIEQNIKFGEKLVNRDLRERFGVSSTPVRDAINRLYQDGLLEDISNVGARVIPFTAEFAVEVNEIIALLNIEAIKLAARKSQPAEILPVLIDCVAQQNEFVDDIRYFDHDKKFHMTFFDFCYNERFKQIYVQYQTLWEILVKFHSDTHSTKKHSIEQHRQIIDAYTSGYIVQAQQIMEQHYQDANLSFSRMLHIP